MHYVICVDEPLLLSALSFLWFVPSSCFSIICRIHILIASNALILYLFQNLPFHYDLHLFCFDFAFMICISFFVFIFIPFWAMLFVIFYVTGNMAVSEFCITEQSIHCIMILDIICIYSFVFWIAFFRAALLSHHVIGYSCFDEWCVFTYMVFWLHS